MKVIRKVFNAIRQEWRLQWLGRSALVEMRFRKYRLPYRGNGRRLREKVLRRLGAPWITTSRPSTTLC